LSEAELVECIDLQTQLDSMYMTEGSFIRWRKILQSTTHFFRIEHNNSRNTTINSLNRLSTVLSFLILRKLAHFVQTSIVIYLYNDLYSFSIDHVRFVTNLRYN